MTFLNYVGQGYEFEGKDKKKYKFAPLSLVDWGKFIAWVQYKPYRDAVAAELPEELCDKVYEKCVTGKVEEEVEEGKYELFDINLNSTVVKQSLNTLEGVGKLAEISLLINHPELKDRNIGEVIDLTNIGDIQTVILQENDLIDDKDEDDTSDPTINPDL